jgi:glycine hydroxymethyltransferase
MCREEYAKAIDSAVFPGSQGGPLMHVIAAKAICFAEAAKPEFKAYQQQVIDNAKALAAGLSERGLHLVSGGTDNHLLLVDLRPSHPDLTGKAAQNALEKAHLTLNRNTVPGETRSPFQASGLRIGSPAVTSRGMKEEQMNEIADIIADVLDDPENDAVLETARQKALAICDKFLLI